jgi:hypothetical protein
LVDLGPSSCRVPFGGRGPSSGGIRNHRQQTSTRVSRPRERDQQESAGRSQTATLFRSGLQETNGKSTKSREQDRRAVDHRAAWGSLRESQLSESKLLSRLARAALFVLGVFSLASLSPLSGGEIIIYLSGGVEGFPIAESPLSKATESCNRVADTCVMNCDELKGSGEGSPPAGRQTPGQAAGQDDSSKNVKVEIAINQPAVQYPVIPYWYGPPHRPKPTPLPKPSLSPTPPGSIAPPSR